MSNGNIKDKNNANVSLAMVARPVYQGNGLKSAQFGRCGFTVLHKSSLRIFFDTLTFRFF